MALLTASSLSMVLPAAATAGAVTASIARHTTARDTAGQQSTGPHTMGQYSIVDLGAFPGGSSEANAVSNSGEVVGDSSVNGAPRAVWWSAAGVLHDLGTLPGGAVSQANGVNDSGQIAGLSDRADGGYAYPVRWSAAGVITDLGGPVTNRLGAGNAIDPAGRVAGGQRPADSEGYPLGILYAADGSPTELGAELGIARGINGRGQVVGGNPAYVWQSGVVRLLPGLIGGDAGGSVADAVNNAGQVVGSSSVGGYGTHAVLWSGNSVLDMGTIDQAQFSTATAVNASGQVVGTADPMCQPCAPSRAWIWTPGGSITPLDSLIPAGSGWSLRTANGINDRGEVVGAGLHNGQLHAYAMSPPFHININFQPSGARIPQGYLADTGAVYGERGNGLSYGWNVDNKANARERNAKFSPDQRYDTFTQLQKPSGVVRGWQLSVPNGSYLVHVVAGDPDYVDSVFRLLVEGRTAISGTPSSAKHWFEGTVRVTVADGNLTITNGAGSYNNKIDYVDVLAVCP